MLVFAASAAMLNGAPFNKYDVAFMLPLNVTLPPAVSNNLFVSLPNKDDFI